MIAPELARKIRYIQVCTCKAVNDCLAGDYHSVFKGQGIEFEEVREYQPGDEVRSIDWNVTARMGHPFVKRFIEERELTVMFLVDLSASGAFGSISKIKNEVAAELCALLAFSAIKNNDKVGLIAFTSGIEMFVPPAKGTSHVQRLIRDLLIFQPRQTETNISQAIDYLGRVTTKRCVVFLVSDFFDSAFEKPLRVMGRRHDVIAVSITDPREVQIPNVGLVELEDAETGAVLQIDAGRDQFRRRYEELAGSRQRQLQELFRSMDIDHIAICTERDYVRELVKFCRVRQCRART